ncbi:hypothetical protein [Donghicola mangrovi]|uniref:hypothetical protein n=1 Tax=Donghicola mangrovi TaxID=2729614 RepID=UPI001D15DD43|nr:hypothetical protein [Donghicola mangrovi]
MRCKSVFPALFIAILLAGQTKADEPQILSATAQKEGLGWRIEVTVSHNDTGWDHFVDFWSIETRDGTEIERRTLLHPHPEEQPLTRSLSGVSVPDGIRKVFVRAHCRRDGWSKDRFMLKLK